MSYFELTENLILKHGNKTSKIVRVTQGNISRFILNTRKLDNLLDGYNSDT